MRCFNITSIFVQSASTTGLIALGMTMIICAGQIDISVGAQVAIISGFGIEILNLTHNIWIMLLFCLALGAAIGTFNGLLVAKGRMPAMIATLAMQTSTTLARAARSPLRRAFPPSRTIRPSARWRQAL